MGTIPFVRWIANAAACLTGPHGAVTEQAQQSGCSRQSAYDHSQTMIRERAKNPAGSGVSRGKRHVITPARKLLTNHCGPGPEVGQAFQPDAVGPDRK